MIHISYGRGVARAGIPIRWDEERECVETEMGWQEGEAMVHFCKDWRWEIEMEKDSLNAPKSRNIYLVLSRPSRNIVQIIFNFLEIFHCIRPS